jgi:hypothetical protein
MASLPNRLPAEDAAALYTAIDAAARQQQKANPEGKRTLVGMSTRFGPAVMT